jgi:hypothetical protein
MLFANLMRADPPDVLADLSQTILILPYRLWRKLALDLAVVRNSGTCFSIRVSTGEKACCDRNIKCLKDQNLFRCLRLDLRCRSRTVIEMLRIPNEKDL